MSCTRDEIEEKRIQALQRKQQTLMKYKTNSPINNNPLNRGNDHFHGYQSRQNKKSERFSPISTMKFFEQKTGVICTCYMITNVRFVLHLSSWFPALIEVMKKIPSSLYDPKTKTWSFNLSNYETLMEKIMQFKSDIRIIGLPGIIIRIFRKDFNLKKIAENMDLSMIDPHLLESLMPFQRDGVCYGISRGGRCMIADDMGLGKTIQALGIAHYFEKNWPLLIIVPASIRYQWTDAIHKFLPSVDPMSILQYTSTEDDINNSKIVIVTYDLLVRAVDTFETRIFGFVILDESHALKSLKTARYKAVHRITMQAGHVVLLSGTPALSRPIELYSQINLVMPKFMRYEDYGIRYCAGRKNDYSWDFTGSSNMQELQLLLKHTCVIRRLKNDVLNQLPSKKREVIELDPDLIRIGTNDMTDMLSKLKKKSLNGKERQSMLIQYYNESSFIKQKAICNYITTLFKEREKCIIFAHHQNVLDAICAVADSMKIKYIRIDGKTTSINKKRQLDNFQSDNDYIAAILSITTANAGINLTSAQLVIFAELFWNPGILCQAEDRVHRIGQDGNVIVRYLIAKRTADDYLWPLIQKKMNVLNEAGLDLDFAIEDIDDSRQALNSNQPTLDSFSNKHQCEQNTEEETECKEMECENDKKDAIAQNKSLSSEDLKELQDLSQVEFDFGDWDEVE